MPSLSGIRNLSSIKPVSINQAAEMAKGQGVSEKSNTLMKEVAGLLATDRAVRITNAPVIRSEAGTPTGPTGTPVIDNPDDPRAKEVDLEKLIMYLQLENAEEQEQLAQDRINVQKDSLASTHKERMSKLQETLEKMDKAAKSAKFNKIFGWLMAAVAVVIAIAACVATGGLAVGPVIGAALAVGTCLLNETGVMDKITKGLAKELQKLGMSKEAAQIVAQVTVALAIMAASLACCGAGAGSALSGTANAVQQLAQNIQKGANIAMKLMGIVSIISGGVGSALNYSAGMSEAELTELTKVLALLRQQMEESEDELQQILELIMISSL